MNPREGRPQPLTLALAGLGTVGSAVVGLLQRHSEYYLRLLERPIQLVAVFDRSYRNKDLSRLPPGVQVGDSLEPFLNAEAQVVVELIGGQDPAERIVLESLRRGKAVVTANKFLMALSGPRLLSLARKHDSYLGFEASVAGGVPVLRSLRRSLWADRIQRIQAILSGTCNFILTEMAAAERSFDEVLGEAQKLGYAEADPTLDVSGRDTADKLVILTGLASGHWVKARQIPTMGITGVRPLDFACARKLGATIRMLGVARLGEGEVEMRVGPFLVDEQLPLAQICGVTNAVEIQSCCLGSVLFSGPGAGGPPTAVSVVADILNAALWLHGGRRRRPPLPSSEKADLVTTRRSDGDHYPFYLRLLPKSPERIIRETTDILARQGIRIDSVVLESPPEDPEHPLVVSVAPTNDSALQRALAEIGKPRYSQAPALALPILRPQS